MESVGRPEKVHSAQKRTDSWMTGYCVVARCQIDIPTRAALMGLRRGTTKGVISQLELQVGAQMGLLLGREQ